MSLLLNTRSSRRLALAVVASVGVSLSGCSGQLTAHSRIPGAVTPSDVLASPESFLNLQVQVEGRIHVEKYETALPCIPDTGAGCTSPAFTSLHVVTTGEPKGTANALDLYRPAGETGQEPLRCTVIGQQQFDCGAFKEDAVATVTGRIVKHRIPIEEVGDSSGRMQVIRYREIYVLLVQP